MPTNIVHNFYTDFSAFQFFTISTLPSTYIGELIDCRTEIPTFVDFFFFSKSGPNTTLFRTKTFYDVTMPKIYIRGENFFPTACRADPKILRPRILRKL